MAKTTVFGKEQSYRDSYFDGENGIYRLSMEVKKVMGVEIAGLG